MRKDFNKLLVERERVNHRDHYHHYRHVKGPKGAWDDDEVGGRERMRVRYNHGYNRKSFNENLNPLYGWIRSCVGKKWDKCYSELCKTFDMRGVINAHILEHLWETIERHAFVNEKGAVMTHRGYSFGGKSAAHGDPVPIAQCGKDYYICPKDGTLKKTQKQSRRSIIKQREAEKKAKELAVRRYLNDREVLHLIDGVWYHFDLLPIPDARVVYEKPDGTDIFETGYSFRGTPTSRREKTWDELNQAERERFGQARVVGGTARDELTNEVVYRDQKGVVHPATSWTNDRPADAQVGLYHANKKTANKKHLKQAGLL
jgi:hypothetical protein